MKQELLTALIVTATVLCTGVVLFLSYLHWQAGKIWQTSLEKAKPLEALLRDHPSQSKKSM